jgi:VWFA-related protein
MMRKFVCTLAFMTLVVASDAAQQQPPPQRATGTVEGRVNAVLVDIVVRDKRGEPVRDLTQADFEVFEDGAPQKIGSFTQVSNGVAPAPNDMRSTTAATGSAPASPSAASPSGPMVTALVFDRLSPDGQRLAVDAAKKYLASKEETPDYFAVFSVDLALTPYAPFTRNTRVIRDALDKIAERASSQFANPEEQQRRRNLEQAAAAAGQATTPSGAGGPGGAPQMGTAAGDAQLALMEANMIRDFDAMARNQEGYAMTNGLFAIIGAMRALPGRKSMVFFSEGIAIPPPVHRLFLGVIDAANRANVSIYTMDAAGLRAESEQAKIRDEVNQSARRGINTGYAGNTKTDAPLMKDLEKNEDVLRQDPHSGLGELAQDTGGLLFENSNNLRQGFIRIENDLRNYYLVGYTPSNENYDGRFRTIDVKVKRPGVTVAARKGYFAVRDAGGASISPWEAPAFGALEQKPVPNAFPVRAGALLFPERERPGLVPVIVDFRTAPLTFGPSEDGKGYVSDFAVLVRFLDQKNQIVRKVSQHYEVKGAIAEIDRAKQGEVLFYREPELAPGVYTMEAIVYDAPSGKSSARFATVEVPSVDPALLQMSSLVLVRRGEKVSQVDRRPDNPLLVGDTVLYPNLGDPVSKAAKEVGFYFAVYPGQGGSTVECVLQLLQNGSKIAELPISLGAPDRSGRIQEAGRLPIDRLSPGTYELQVAVKQGNRQVSRSTLLRIVD